MAEQVPYKYYNIGGSNPYQAIQGSNTPYGAQELNYDEYISGLKSFIPTDVIKSYGSQQGEAFYGINMGESAYDFYQRTNPTKLQNISGTPSGYVTQNGILTTQQAIDEQAAQAAGIASGTLKNVGTTTAPATVPVGSPGATNPLGVNNAVQGTVQGTLPNGEQATFLNADIAKQYGAVLKQGFQTAVDSGQQAPTTEGQAASAIQKFTPPTSNFAAQMANMETQLAQDPGYQQLLADRAEFNSVVNQTKSLTETYSQITKDLGIPAMNTELMNMKNVIEGTEDDLRAEVTKAGGFATESQILALTNSRNKQLIKNYNNLLQTKQMAMETLNTMIGLAVADRQFAMQAISQKLQIDQQIIEYRQRMQDNARASYQSILEQVGYEGLSQMTGGDPYYTSLVERTLGLGQGGLQQLSTYTQQQRNLAQLADYNVTSPYVLVGQEVRDANTGYAFTSPQDFQARTGMTLDQAGAKNMIQRLGLTREQEQQEFENQLAVGRFGLEQQRVGLEGARLGIAKVELALKMQQQANMGTLTGEPQTATQLTANGYADRLLEADAIIAELGKNFTGTFSMLPLFNFMKSDDRQSYEQAQRNFINAVLRRESGAAIAESEFDSAAKQYFPQPGDSLQVIEQKARNRNTVISNFYREANIVRPLLPGQIIESGGKQYQVAEDGITLIPL